MTDKEIILTALSVWKNYIETGDVCLSAQDAMNCGKFDVVKKLEPSQQQFISNIDRLVSDVYGGKILGGVKSGGMTLSEK